MPNPTASRHCCASEMKRIVTALNTPHHIRRISPQVKAKWIERLTLLSFFILSVAGFLMVSTWDFENSVSLEKINLSRAVNTDTAHPSFSGPIGPDGIPDSDVKDKNAPLAGGASK